MGFVGMETLILVLIVVGIFLLALFCLACSLNPREILDGSLSRCCCGRCRRRRHIDSPQIYESLHDFIVETDEGDDETGAFASVNNVPRTLGQVFPDLLGIGGQPLTPMRRPQTGDDIEAPQGHSSESSSNSGLGEPLL